MSGTNWIAGLAALLPHVSNVFLRNALSTILVAALGAGGFAGAFYGLGSRPVQVDQVSLDEGTVRAIMSEAVDSVSSEIRALEATASKNTQQIQATSIRLDKSEELQLENLRIVNRLLGRIESLDVLGRPD